MKLLRQFSVAAGFVCVAALLGTAPSAPANPAAVSASALEDQADRQYREGDYLGSTVDAVTALRLRYEESGPHTVEFLDTLRRVALVFSEMGDSELASAVWRVTREASVAAFGPDHPRVAEAKTRFAAVDRHVNLTSESYVATQREVLEHLDPNAPEAVPVRASATRALGYLQWRVDSERALSLLREARVLFESVEGLELDVATTCIWIGWTLVQLGRHDEARREFDDAHRASRRGGASQHPLEEVIEAALADICMIRGDWRAAEVHYENALMPRPPGRADPSSRFSGLGLHGGNLLALSRLKQGRSVDAWEALQSYRGQAGRLLRALHLHGESMGGRSMAATRAELLEHRALRRPSGDPAIDWNEVLVELEANVRLLVSEAAMAPLRFSGLPNIADVQATLEDDWAYVGWLDSRAGNNIMRSSPKILDSRWIYVIRPRRPIQWIPLWEFDAAETQTAERWSASEHGALLQQAASWTLRVDDDPLLARYARDLAEKEFAPALPFLEGVNHLVLEFFEDHTSWHPFELLILPDNRYLDERFTVSYTPSADAFVASRRNAGSFPRNGPVLAIGDAIFHSSDSAADRLGAPDIASASSQIDLTVHRAATNGDVESLNALPRLPFAHAELAAIASSFPGAVVVRGAAATEPRVRSYFDGSPREPYRIVHFTTHGLSETKLLQRCALALSRNGVDGSPANDGLLDALEIQLGWKLRADLVTLSGCQSASGHGFRRGEPWGLATVLLASGANSVVASLWKVDDLATARLMERFYENLSRADSSPAGEKRGRLDSKARALSEAKTWLRNEVDASGKRMFSHPVYWAGFILMGNPD